MIYTIRAWTTKGKDLLGLSVFSAAQKIIGKDLISVHTNRVYRLEGATEKSAKILAEKLLSEPINQEYSINNPRQKNGDQTIEISYKPGVMNPEVASIIKAAADMGIHLEAADSSTEYTFVGSLQKEKLKKLIPSLRLFNPIIEHLVETEPQTLIIQGKPGKTVIVPIRSMTNEELLELSKNKLFLNLEEMHIIQTYFKKIRRDPTDCELETLAQTWSEHCAHKTFKANLIVDGHKKEPLMSRIKKEALKHKKHIVSAFVDNSGVMEFFDGFSICGKVETHNSPSAIEPYGGAMTGSGGVFRDVVATGQGAKTIVSTDIFCFAPPDMDLSLLPKGCLPPDYLLKQVVKGVKDYGNRMGIPTNNGSIHFHNDFRAKPTVIVGAYGLLETKKAQKGSARIGDSVVVVGGKTGRDGIHGATFSSAEMTESTISINSSAVQIGNAIEEKRMFDALSEATEQNVIRAMQDCGAGGFSSAIGEMGEKTGVTVDLGKVSLKYQGLSPWEIWVSESQERMALAIPKTKLKQFLAICKKYNVSAITLGTFDGSKKLKVYYNKELICNLDMQFLHNGLPQRTMIAQKPISVIANLRVSQVKQSHQQKIATSLPAPRNDDRTEPKTEKEWVSILTKVLSHPNICSKEPIVRLYDHSVQGTNALQPYSGKTLDGPNDASVIRPLLNKPYGMVTAHGLNPVLTHIDPYWGSMWAIAEALSNYVAVGGNYKTASLINNYIWPFPDEESLWSLDQSVDAVVDAMKQFKIPVISGKDSLSSTYRNSDGTIIKIPPVLCMSVFGKIKDVTKTISSDFKQTGSVIVLLGNLDTNTITGSVYNNVTLEQSDRASKDSIGRQGNLQNDNTVPHVDLKNLPQIFNTIYQGIQTNTILSCHDISEGGMITALFEMCVGGGMGATIDINVIANLSLTKVKQSHPDQVLFNETAGTFLVELKDKRVAQKLFKDIPYKILGTTHAEKNIRAQSNSKILFSTAIELLKKSWQKPMRQLFS